MKTTLEEVVVHRHAIALIRAYRHSKSNSGLRQDLAVKFMQLDRLLLGFARDLIDERNRELLIEFGEEKILGKPETSFIGKDNPLRGSFIEAQRELLRTEVEIPDHLCVKLSELKVRDEDGELVDIEIGEIGLLGSLLIVQSETP